jgi:hypothetical protein
MAETRLKAGRRWTVGGGGISDLSRRYVIILDSVTGENGEAEEFPGVPKIGSKHPQHPGLIVSG